MKVNSQMIIKESTTNFNPEYLNVVTVPEGFQELMFL